MYLPPILSHLLHSSPGASLLLLPKYRQPLGLCTGCSLCLEGFSPSNLLALCPSAPHTFLCTVSFQTAPTQALHTPQLALFLSTALATYGTYILCLLCIACLPLQISSSRAGSCNGYFTLSPAAAPGCVVFQASTSYPPAWSMSYQQALPKLFSAWVGQH